ncbi:MAG: MoxR family ATPase [Spirochaetales bacterium]|nr:MoxR family ATPase [Spirochaetales bacterium]
MNKDETMPGRDSTGSLEPEAAARTCALLLDEVSKAVVGKRPFLERMLAAAIAGGHVLVEDNPGLAKTLAARSFARTFSSSFKRIQFTPDLLPADITGAFVLDRPTGGLKLVEGPIFANFVLADEINRAPPKTQSALLEAMEERQATLEGQTLALPSPFMVIATQNPIEYEGTFPLPEAQLDRFLVKLSIGYPDREDELELVSRRAARTTEDPEILSVCDGSDLLALREAAGRVHIDRDVMAYAVDLARATRESRRAAVGASPRASLALLKLSRARALMEGRSFVLPDDIKWCAFEALVHRVVLKPEVWANETRVGEVVEDALASVPVPKVSAP